MNIILNGEKLSIGDSTISVQTFLEQQGFNTTKVAVAINMDLVPRSDFAHTSLFEGAEIEVLAAVQGG